MPTTTEDDHPSASEATGKYDQVFGAGGTNRKVVYERKRVCREARAKTGILCNGCHCGL
jgi:hypothetical protein